MKENQARFFAIVSAIFAAACFRLIPHPQNFAPVGALALFSGALLGRRAFAFCAPLAALLLSDLVLGFYAGMYFVYLGVAMIVMLGWMIRTPFSVMSVGALSLASSVLFFVVSNLGVWLLGGLYATTIQGLFSCYIAAIPFFQNTVTGDLFYCALLFGSFTLLEKIIPSIQARALSPA